MAQLCQVRMQFTDCTLQSYINDISISYSNHRQTQIENKYVIKYLIYCFILYLFVLYLYSYYICGFKKENMLGSNFQRNMLPISNMNYKSDLFLNSFRPLSFRTKAATERGERY